MILLLSAGASLGLTASACSAPSSPASAGEGDGAAWRVQGNPLVAHTGTGELDGLRFGVKDLYAIAGQKIGAGNPVFLDEAKTETETAPAIATLLAAGADLVGITATDEFAYSIAGTNGHYPTPPNAAAPDRIPGGSSSGSASAAASGAVDFAVGTDTGGSIRVPSSYQGLFGLRTTHGAVNAEGLVPLAQSFDTVGWMAADPDVFTRVTQVQLPDSTAGWDDVVYSPDLTGLVEPEVRIAVEQAIGRWRGTGQAVRDIPWDANALPGAVKAFQTVQAHEAWLNHGPWIETHWDTLNPDVRGRFENAAKGTPADVEAAASALAGYRTSFDAALGNELLALPAASSVAPLLTEAALGGSRIESIRSNTFKLTCIAGITGRPAVVVPVAPAGDIPVGLCLLGPRGSDLRLAELTKTLTDTGVAIRR